MAELTAALAENERLRKENAALRAAITDISKAPTASNVPHISDTVKPRDGVADHLKGRSYQMTGDARDQKSWVKMAQVNTCRRRPLGVTPILPSSIAMEFRAIQGLCKPKHPRVGISVADASIGLAVTKQSTLS